MKALVTGASGFVGHAVCAELLERDHEVAALVRRPGSEPPGSTAVQGDLADAGALARVVECVRPDCVIHLAAEIASQRDAAKIAEVNVEGTRRLLAACEAAGVRRIRLRLDRRHRRREAARCSTRTTPLPVETAYGRSKQEGERLVRESGLDDVIIRPEPRLRPGRLVRGGVRQPAAPAGPLRGDRLGRELVGRRPGRGRRHAPASTPPSAPPPGPSTTSSTTSRSASTTSSRSPQRPSAWARRGGSPPGSRASPRAPTLSAP